MTTAYPLAWPFGWPRTKVAASSRMKASISSAVRNVTDEMRRFGKDTDREVTDVTISSNVTLTTSRPADAGVAVYFRWDGIDCCIAVDRYRLPEENLQAVALILDAERTKMRHGGLNIVRQAMRGYASLPPPKGADGALPPPWRSVLGIGETGTLKQAEEAYRTLVKTAHPDRGGSPARFNQITDAISQARAELGR